MAETARSELEIKLKKKEDELLATVDALEQEIRAAESERDELKKRCRKSGVS